MMSGVADQHFVGHRRTSLVSTPLLKTLHTF